MQSVRQRAHDELIGRLERYWTTGEEDIRGPFSKIIEYKHPDPPKKRIRGSRE